jgi:hypothetical protein
VLAYGEGCGSAPRAQRTYVRLVLVGVHEGLGILGPRWVENSATTIHNNNYRTGMLERVELFCRRVQYCITAVTLNTSCDDCVFLLILKLLKRNKTKRDFLSNIMNRTSNKYRNTKA